MKRFLIISLVLLTCNVSFSQYKKYKVSWLGSFNLNHITPVNNQRDYVFGANGLNYSTGFKFKYGLLKNNQLGLSLATVFSKLAYRSSAKVDGLTYPTLDFNSSYFQLPFAVSWSFYKTRHFDLSVPVGVAPSFLLKSRSNYYGGITPTSPKTLKTLMGYQAGVELSYTKNLKLFLAFQPNFIYYPKSFDEYESKSAYTFQFLFNVGYMF